MKIMLTLILSSIFATSLVAQVPTGKDPLEISRAYQRSRMAITTPSYGLKTVQAVLSTSTINNSDRSDAISTDSFNALTLEQKFTYVMIHGEDDGQSCYLDDPELGEEKKIYLPYKFHLPDDGVWSARQLAFLKQNRSKVISLIRNTMKEKKQVGANLKNAIIELSAYELIPDLITVYNQTQTDQDILSVCIILMRDAKFDPYIKSTLPQAFEQSITGEGAHQRWPEGGYVQPPSIVEDPCVEATPKNKQLVMNLAMKFYKKQQRSHKK